MDENYSDTGSFYDPKAVIARVCEVAGVTSMRALSQHFGRSPSRVGALVRDNSLPWEDIAGLACQSGVSMDWFLWGEKRIDNRSGDLFERMGASEAVRGGSQDVAYRKGREGPPLEEADVRQPRSPYDGAPAALDWYALLVRELVRLVDEALADQRQELAPRRRASVIATLFRMHAVKGEMPEVSDVRAIVDLSIE